MLLQFQTVPLHELDDLAYLVGLSLGAVPLDVDTLPDGRVAVQAVAPRRRSRTKPRAPNKRCRSRKATLAKSPVRNV